MFLLHSFPYFSCWLNKLQTLSKSFPLSVRFRCFLQKVILIVKLHCLTTNYALQRISQVITKKSFSKVKQNNVETVQWPWKSSSSTQSVILCILPSHQISLQPPTKKWILYFRTKKGQQRGCWKVLENWRTKRNSEILILTNKAIRRKKVQK